MLSVGKITSGPAAARYYLDQVARGREDYYAGEGEAAGVWVGAGASVLGWSGEVDADEFGRCRVVRGCVACVLTASRDSI